MTRSARIAASPWSWVTYTVVTWSVRWRRASSLRRRVAQLGVEARKRLVQEEHARLTDQGPGERHTLLLTTRELVRIPTGQLLDANERQDLLNSRGSVRARHLHRLEDEIQIPLNRQMRPQRQDPERRTRFPARGAAPCCGAAPAACAPASQISPLSGTSSPAISRSSVVLPQPLGPRMTTASPAATSSDTPSTAWCDAESLGDVRQGEKRMNSPGLPERHGRSERRERDEDDGGLQERQRSDVR